MPEASDLTTPVSVSDVTAIAAEVLDTEEAQIDPHAPLTSLGLESFTAVRLRRRIRDDLDIDLPLTGFLGDATVTTIARGIADPRREADAPPAPVDDTFPLTPLQTAYWIGRDPAFPLGGVATFYYREYDRRPDASPEEDLERLNAAWNRLVDHHPMLRMVVDANGRQRILAAIQPYRIAVTDLRAAGTDSARRALDELRHAHSHQLRPTDRWPLFDIHAIFLPDGRTRLLIGVDVLTLDFAGWMQVLDEWGTLVADPAAQLPVPPHTFADVVRRRADDPEERAQRARDLAYWRDRAPTLPSGPRLPWATDLDQLGVHRCARHAQRLTPEEWHRLRSRAAEHGLSPTGLLLAAFGLTLARWGATEPFALNTTLFDRPDIPELRHVIGDFTSTLLVEIPQPRLTEWDGFLGYATQVNRRFWTDLDHRSVPGVEVMRQNGAPTLTPTHPVVFTSGLGLTEPGSDPAGWLGEEVFGISQTPQVALDHIVHEEGGALRICWDYAEGALHGPVVAGMAAAHALLLRRLANEHDTWTDPTVGWDPAFLPDEPLRCQPFPEAGPLLDDPLRSAAERHPDRPALLDARGAVSHGELAIRAHRTASQLAATGAGPGDLVAVSLDKGVDQVAALAGVMASGAGYVPVEPTWPADRIASVCSQAGITRAVVAPGSPTVWPETVRVHEIDAAGGLSPEPAGTDLAEPRPPAPDDLAYVIFTSGSTGRPKGVAIEHRAARTTIDDLIDRFPVGPDDRMLGLSTFSFDLSVHDIFGVVGTGAALVLPEAERQRDPGHWLELMAQHRVTLWNTAPALLEMLVEYAEVEPEAARAALSHLRVVFLSADWIPVTLPDRLRALAPNAEVVSLGGATEASIWSICYPIGQVDAAWPSIPYGRALRGQSFHILDPETGSPQPAGHTGELHIGGAGLARGYIGDPTQTAERFIEHPVLGRLYRTGDLGRWRSDGTIEFLGRLDRQVKIRGHRIELGEVESALDRIPGVRQAVAMSVRGPDDRPRLVAYLMDSESQPAPSDDRLITLLRERVPEFMVPSRFVRLSGFPVTDNGKIDYKALPNPYDRGTTPTRAPRPEPSATPAAAAPEGPEAHVPDDVTSSDVSPTPPATPQAPPAGGDSLLSAALSALEEGLSVSVRMGPGNLAPASALTAAGAMAARLESMTLPRGITASQRLCPDGLVEITLHTAANGAAPTTSTASNSAASTSASSNGAALKSAALNSAAQDGDVPERSPAAGAPTPTSELPPFAAGPGANDPTVENAIVGVFETLLDTVIDPETAFFRMGATSLTLVLAHRRLAEETAPELSVVDLFTYPTARQLARHITGLRGSVPPPRPEGNTADSPSPVAEADSATTPDSRAAARRRARAIAMEVAG